MADCTCNNFPSSLGTITFQSDVEMLTHLGVGGAPSPNDSLIVAASLNMNDQLLRNVSTLSLCQGCGYYQWVNSANTAALMVLTNSGQLGLGTTSPTQLLHLQGGSLYINGGNILVSGDVTTGVGAFYATNTKVADSGGCYYGN